MADPLEADNPVEEGVDERPEWLPENFDTPESLVQSYKEAQRKITETAQHNKALEENYMTLAAQVEELQAQPRVDPSDARSQLYDQFENNPIETVAMIANQAAQAQFEKLQQQLNQQVQPVVQANQNIAAEQAWNGLVTQNPDIANYQQQIGDFIQENQEYFPNQNMQDPRLISKSLENVYKIVSRDAAVTNAATQAEQAAQLQQMKLQAQTMSGATGHPMPPDQAKAEWEAIKNADKKPW